MQNTASGKKAAKGRQRNTDRCSKHAKGEGGEAVGDGGRDAKVARLAAESAGGGERGREGDSRSESTGARESNERAEERKAEDYRVGEYRGEERDKEGAQRMIAGECVARRRGRGGGGMLVLPRALRSLRTAPCPSG